MDLYWYMTVRDFTYLLIWQEQDRRNMALAEQLRRDPFGEQASCGGGRRPPDGAPPAGDDGGGGGPPPGPPGAPVPPPSSWFELADEDAAPPDKSEDLSFLQSVFAFVFGRGGANDDLELRRARAIGMLLRACQGCVFAEQVSPFCDTYLLHMSRASAAAAVPTAAPAGLWRRLFSRRGKGDSERDLLRMHEGWMLPVLSRFGGHAEASDDGRLVYVFPALRVSAAGAGEGPSAPPAAAPPPVAPPIYERPQRVWDGGDKQPLVVLLGIANAGLLMLFRAIGGMRLELDPSVGGEAAAKRARAMGRRAGGGFAAGSHGPREIDPAVLAALTSVVRLCARLMPILGAYATFFFALPCARAVLASAENERIRKRNAVRKAAAAEALQATLQAVEDGRAAATAKHRAPLVMAYEGA